MAANEYHFVSRWRVEGACGAVADVLADPLALQKRQGAQQRRLRAQGEERLKADLARRRATSAA